MVDSRASKTHLDEEDKFEIQGVFGPDLGPRLSSRLRVTDKVSGRDACIKQVKKEALNSSHSSPNSSPTTSVSSYSTSMTWRDVMNERLVWQKMTGTAHILPLMSFIENKDSYCFISDSLEGYYPLSALMESCSRSRVSSRRGHEQASHKRSVIPIQVTRVLTGQLAVLIDKCHRKGVLLRCLSTETILVNRTSGQIMLANFEFSKLECVSKRRVSVMKTDNSFSLSCLPSPEMIRGQSYGHEVDWWAFALILLQMLTGMDAFAKVKKSIGSNGYPFLRVECEYYFVGEKSLFVFSIAIFQSKELPREILIDSPKLYSTLRFNRWQHFVLNDENSSLFLFCSSFLFFVFNPLSGRGIGSNRANSLLAWKDCWFWLFKDSCTSFTSKPFDGGNHLCLSNPLNITVL